MTLTLSKQSDQTSLDETVALLAASIDESKEELDESKEELDESDIQDSCYNDTIEDYYLLEAKIQSLTPLQNIANLDDESFTRETGFKMKNRRDYPYIACNKTNYGNTDIIYFKYLSGANIQDFYPCTFYFFSSANKETKSFEYNPSYNMSRIASPANVKYYVEVLPGSETTYFIKDLRDKIVMVVQGYEDGTFKMVNIDDLLSNKIISPTSVEYTIGQLERYKEFALSGDLSVSINGQLNEFSYGQRQELEIKDENGNYRTYIAPFKSKYICFYTDNKKYESASQFSVNYVFIDGKSYSIYSFLNNPFLYSALSFTPRRWRKLENGKLMINYEAEYKEPPLIIYTPPKYIVMRGQVIEDNNGINYEYDTNQRGFIAIIDQETMEAEKTICLEGITRPEIYAVGNNYLVFNRNRYSSTQTVSENRTPIYLLRDDFSVKSCLVPDEGETFLDVAWIADRFLVFCGTTTTHGFLDYNNPLVVVWDTQANITYKEYSPIERAKDFLYTKIVKLPLDCFAVQYNFNEFDSFAIKDIILKRLKLERQESEGYLRELLERDEYLTKRIIAKSIYEFKKTDRDLTEYLKTGRDVYVTFIFTYTFKEDGTGNSALYTTTNGLRTPYDSPDPIRWEVKNGKLIVYMDEYDYTYDIIDDGEELLEEGPDHNYYK